MLLFRWLRLWIHWLQTACFGGVSEGNRTRGSVLCLAICLCYVAFNSFFLDKTPLPDLLSQPRTPQDHTPLSPSAKFVGDWTCVDVGHWLKQQRWGWRQIDDYIERLCVIGVTGRTLYVVDEGVLANDVGVTYTFHQKLILETLRELQARVRHPETEASKKLRYKPSSPAKAALYFGGFLCTPRLTALWLWSKEHLSPKEEQPSVKFVSAAPNVASSGAALGAVFDMWLSATIKLRYDWVAWLLCPGIAVSAVALKHFAAHPCIALYATIIGVLHTAAEVCVAHILLCHRDMSGSEKCMRLLCSHLVAPLVCVMAGLMQMASVHFLPSAVSNMMYWLLCVTLPPWAIWGCFGTWSEQDTGSAPSQMRFGFLDGPTDWSAGSHVDGSHHHHHHYHQGGDIARRISSNYAMNRELREAASVPHWPQPIAVPSGMMEDQAPAFIKCPITLSVMRQPAQTAAGITYEYAALMQWLEQHRCDPVTRTPLKRRHVVPNLAIRAAIEQWMEHQ